MYLTITKCIITIHHTTIYYSIILQILTYQYIISFILVYYNNDINITTCMFTKGICREKYSNTCVKCPLYSSTIHLDYTHEIT